MGLASGEVERRRELAGARPRVLDADGDEAVAKKPRDGIVAAERPLLQESEPDAGGGHHPGEGC